MRASGVSPCRIVKEQDDILIPSIVWPWWVYTVLPEVKVVCSCDTAHLHHGWEVYTNEGKTVTAAKRALLVTCEVVYDESLEIRSDVYICVRTVIQLAYTTLFGYHCAFLFLRTGSLYPPLFSHVFCNFMGLPQIGFELQVFPHRKLCECFHFNELGGCDR